MAIPIHIRQGAKAPWSPPVSILLEKKHLGTSISEQVDLTPNDIGTLTEYEAPLTFYIGLYDNARSYTAAP
ncbi:hypothetical protein AAC03nite_18200 [Alicyclobacillus acidoterrestris]|nr:hypothetical protein AAC03nite_18200 [Alicyclobacillus acidoterrestris]